MDNAFYLLIRQGAEAWNRWYLSHPWAWRENQVYPTLEEFEEHAPKFIEPDLNFADLRGLKLDGIILNGADLQWVCLDGASLRGAQFEGACLIRCSLKDADLEKASFQTAEITLTNFERANLRHADFRYTKPLWTRFANADVEGAIFESRYRCLQRARNVQQIRIEADPRE